MFRCDVNEATPVPTALPEVAWRAGLDLAPIDVTDDESVSWLESLVWPGEGDRLALLRAAIAVARADPPRVVRGDLRHDLPALAAAGARRTRRSWSFTRRCSAMCTTRRTAGASPTRCRSSSARWIANEPPGVIELERPPRPGPAPGGEILLTLDAEPVAWTDPHGAWVQWLA